VAGHQATPGAALALDAAAREKGFGAAGQPHCAQARNGMGRG
jgi:hypothetical protein